MNRKLFSLILYPLCLSITACTTSYDRTAEAPPAIEEPVDVYEKEGAASVDGADFDALWMAAEESARARLFSIDRRDRRGGVLTTEPMTSAQFFEPWRQDAIGFEPALESSLATIRRTIRFEITRTGGEGNETSPAAYQVTPKVLVERFSQTEKRVTNVVLYRGIFRTGRVNDLAPYGTRETDRGVFLPAQYWYPVGRDEELERRLADDIRERLN